MLIAVTAFVGTWGYLSRQLVPLGIAVAFGILGAVLLAASIRSVTVRYREVVIDPSGLTLVMQNGREWRATWRDPALRFLLFDHSGTTAPALLRYREVPCQLFSLQFHAGLSREACGALIDQARRSNVRLADETDADGVRTVTVGPGPETGQPFQRL